MKLVQAFLQASAEDDALKASDVTNPSRSESLSPTAIEPIKLIITKGSRSDPQDLPNSFNAQGPEDGEIPDSPEDEGDGLDSSDAKSGSNKRKSSDATSGSNKRKSSDDTSGSNKRKSSDEPLNSKKEKKLSPAELRRRAKRTRTFEPPQVWGKNSGLLELKSGAALREILLSPGAWSFLPPAGQQAVLAKLPNGFQKDGRPDVEALKNDDNFRNDCAHYYDHLRAGHLTENWLTKAWKAHYKDVRGDFKKHLQRDFEETYLNDARSTKETDNDPSKKAENEASKKTENDPSKDTETEVGKKTENETSETDTDSSKKTDTESSKQDEVRMDIDDKSVPAGDDQTQDATGKAPSSKAN
ncbi:hypothetical protein QBC41DRAFT_232493 [Cercophora samala]|uniref:ASX DEUBAD domain-containing protein n=1 Tax=Cercophora samala TaxID=330535 RepID=A0AA40D709_9PEZI|nr:hypothetical protein QBC41DRAFT_232493 [Cercophora samala]